MKRELSFSIFVLFLLMVFSTGCGAKIARSNDYGTTAESAPKEEMNVDRFPAEIPEEVGIDTVSRGKNTNQKLIYRASINVEVTNKIEPLITSVQNFVENYNGYIEHMEQYRNGYDPVTGERLEGISMTIRIPHEHYDKALQTISELGVVVNKSSSVEDVTLQYSDIESTLKMYKIEQERLLEMLQNKTADVKDMIEIEKRLSEVRVEIEKQESARRSLESLINYDTIQLEISEVRRVSTTNETKNFGARIKGAFAKSIDGVTVFMQNLILSFTYMLVPLSILLIVAILIYIPISKFKHKKKKNILSPSDETKNQKE